MAWNRQSSNVPAIKVPRITIGIPYEMKVTMLWAMRMFAPLLYVPTNWCEKVPQMARGVPQSVARDQIVELSLADPNVTHILWVDTDSVCESPTDPNVALNQLYQCNVPIVSGLYRAKQKQGFNYAAWVDAKLPNQLGFTPIQSYTGNFFQVDTIGMGFCLVKREVYEKLPKPWYPWPTPSPSEDFNFCIAAKKQGYSINIFANVKISHVGDLLVKTDGSVSVLDI